MFKKICTSVLFLVSFNAYAGTVYYQQPAVSQIDSVFYVAPSSLPAGQLNLVQWNRNPLNPNGDVSISWDLAPYTGLSVPAPLANYQRGVSDQTVGTTGAQVFDTGMGIFIDSNSIKPANATNGMVFPTVAHYDFIPGQEIKPFLKSSNKLVYSIEAQVPVAVADNSTSYAYATLYFNLMDETTGKHFWYGSQLFDLRGTKWATEMVNYDGVTNQAIVAGVMNKGGSYSTRVTSSSPFQGVPWTGYKEFQFVIKPLNLSYAIGSLKTRFPAQYGNLSTNVGNYKVVHFNVNPEIAYFGGSGKIGMSFRNLQISVQDANDCYNTHNGINKVLGTPNRDMRYLCSVKVWYDCGGDSTATWSTHASNGQVVGGYTCDLAAQKWK